jgi:hypothetical protein
MTIFVISSQYWREHKSAACAYIGSALNSNLDSAVVIISHGTTSEFLTSQSDVATYSICPKSTPSGKQLDLRSLTSSVLSTPVTSLPVIDLTHITSKQQRQLFNHLRKLWFHASPYPTPIFLTHDLSLTLVATEASGVLNVGVTPHSVDSIRRMIRNIRTRALLLKWIGNGCLYKIIAKTYRIIKHMRGN